MDPAAAAAAAAAAGGAAAGGAAPGSDGDAGAEAEDGGDTVDADFTVVDEEEEDK